jgi:hypothetical protein
MAASGFGDGVVDGFRGRFDIPADTADGVGTGRKSQDASKDCDRRNA